MRYIKIKNKIFLAIFAVLILGISITEVSGTPNPQEGSWSYRVYFQHVETYENGTGARFTGCVTPGGNCLTQGPNIDQDCLSNGKWSPCGFE